MFDVSRRFLLVNVDISTEVAREEVVFENTDPITKVKRIVELRANVLICGAISWPLEAALTSAGVVVISNTCGPCEDIAAAFIAGEMTERSFLMPGCTGRENRNRGRRRGKR